MNVNELVYNNNELFLEHLSIANDNNSKCQKIFSNPEEYTRKQIRDCIQHMLFSIYVVNITEESLKLFINSQFFQRNPIFNLEAFNRLYRNYSEKSNNNSDELYEGESIDTFNDNVVNLVSSYLLSYIKFLKTQDKDFLILQLRLLLDDISGIDYSSPEYDSDDSGNSGATVKVSYF